MRLLNVFYPDGKHLACVSEAGDAEVWNTANGQKESSFGHGEFAGRSLVGAIALTSDGTRLATLSAQSLAVEVWDTESRTCLVALPKERSPVWPMTWSPNRELMAIGMSDRGLVRWNLPRVRSQLAEIGLEW